VNDVDAKVNTLRPPARRRLGVCVAPPETGPAGPPEDGLAPDDRHAGPGLDGVDAEVTELFRAYRASGDRALRNELVQRHRYLAEICARRFAARGEPLADLLQVALLGLVKAVERFEPDYGSRFPAFAMPTLLGELRRHFRDATWPVHVARRGQELHLAMSAAAERLGQDLGRSPTPAELATAMGVTVEDVLHATEAGNAYRTTPIEPGPSEDIAERAVLALGDGGLGASDARLELHPALAELGERERLIVHLRFFEERTQSEIASIVGLSQVQVSRLLRASLDKLRGRLAT
jgi:RNA polymerase sigma-B factor